MLIQRLLLLAMCIAPAGVSAITVAPPGVLPEPDMLWLIGMGGAVGWFISRFRKRK